VLQFTKLRLSGFKSFVDATELWIEPGLTGIVGPNGCGKSNLVEALRWVMGETSARQMRGGEMDDVIFGGTARRPARNIAETVLEADNTARVALAAFNGAERLEINRRIERGRGSTYRINGREVRARDVHLLFADAASGARSTALVSQGHIGEVIAAKPVQRRALVEEAAGITGLHARRHEAELRLRGAETNLERLDDVLLTLEAQHHALKKQARQASRYRNLSEAIRKAEAAVYTVRWRLASTAVAKAEEELRQAESVVGEFTAQAAKGAAHQAETAAVLPDLRRAEAEAASELQRLVLARETLDAEERRADADREAGRVRLEQLAADLERERTLAADAEASVERLTAERARIVDAQAGEPEAEAAAATAVAEAATVLDAADAEAAALTADLGALDARRAALASAATDLDARRERLDARRVEAERQRAALEAAESIPLAEAEAAADAATATLDQKHTQAEAAEAEATRTTDTAGRCTEAAQAAAAHHTRLEAETRTLASLVNAEDGGEWPAALDTVSVEPALETALAAALGDDLSAPVDAPAPAHWRTLPAFESDAGGGPLPDGVRPLIDHVDAPAALGRRLASIGIVGAEADGHRLQPALRPGQCLVDAEGGLWRWDGYTASSQAPTSAVTRLEAHNRLDMLLVDLAEAARTAQQTAEAAEAARRDAEAATEAHRVARRERDAATTALATARDAAADARQRMAARDSRFAALAETEAAIGAEREEVRGRAAQAATDLAALPDAADLRRRQEDARVRLTELRTEHTRRLAVLDGIRRDADARTRRLADIDAEAASWDSRRAGAQRQVAALLERQTALSADVQRLAVLPTELASRRRDLLSALEAAEARRNDAADRLAVAEAALAEADREARAAEAALVDAREQRVRADAALDQARMSRREVSQRILERLQTTPDQAAVAAGMDDDADLPEMATVEARLQKLQREREIMGPVNLRAEQEAQELAEQVAGMETERRDLVEAIAKLRRGIAELNREGRARLLASFGDVDRHFQELFVRLFGGGRAHLALTDAEDPLDAGVEIMASPPGKRLQALSLLSGGEQTLTALALMFAVFLTNPAPLCVLDEVDAALDDANVDRVCNLLDDMAASGRTRFVVITHHRMTMARMHRLYGVTMTERGISQLVSVDLREAEALRESA